MDINKILIILPVYNEELVLEKNVMTIGKFCDSIFTDQNWKIIIANNNSDDSTEQIGKELERENNRVKYFFVGKKGRGIALKMAMKEFDADIYIYMDIDLAVDLFCLPKLISAVKEGSDMAIGSRFLKNSTVERSLGRTISSKIYKLLADIILRSKITDFQCGFKAFNKKIREDILPLTQNDGFFWDTEIIYLSQILGYKVQEIPVNWSQFRDKKRKSTVKVLETSMDYFKKIWGLRSRGLKLSKRQKQNRADQNSNTHNLRQS